jgi:hypothetical protein
VKRVETSLISSTVLRLELLKCVARLVFFYALSALLLHLPLLLVLLKEPLLCRSAGDCDQRCSLLLGFHLPLMRHLPRGSEIGCS